MPFHKFFFLISFLTASGVAVAQAIDNTASYRIMSADRYVRFQYENDYFSEADIYYTQGMLLEIGNPSFAKLPWNKLMITSATGTMNYGIAIEHNAYTPTSISESEILYGDRPFAAAVFLKVFAINNDPSKHIRVTSSLSAGVLGRAAGGHIIQKKIHQWIGDEDPKGWENQIKNDVILNYETQIEKNILGFRNYFLLNALGNIRAGTLSDKLSVGMTFMAGKINSAITSVFSSTSVQASKAKFTFHIYAQPIVSAVPYDATLQGGLFRDNPYTLSSRQIERFTVQGNYGLVIHLGGVYLEYFQSLSSREFKSADDHKWGGIKLGADL